MRGLFWLVLMLTVLWAGGVRVTHGGLHVWTPIGPYGGYINALAVDPATPSTLYAGTEDGVFKSTDGGGSWQVASSGLTNLDVPTQALAFTAPTTLYAGTIGGSAFAMTTASGLVLSGPSPCLAGATNTLEVTGAPPLAPSPRPRPGDRTVRSSSSPSPRACHSRGIGGYDPSHPGGWLSRSPWEWHQSRATIALTIGQ